MFNTALLTGAAVNGRRSAGAVTRISSITVTSAAFARQGKVSNRAKGLSFMVVLSVAKAGGFCEINQFGAHAMREPGRGHATDVLAA
jgi:hypothetical protein